MRILRSLQVPLVLFVFSLNQNLYATPFSFVAVGDIPYDATMIAEFARSIEQIAKSDAKFVLHVGDIKARKEPCERDVYQLRADLYGGCALPFIVLVGDNEFNDCPDPTAALGLFRDLFCADDWSQGRRTTALERQSRVQPRFEYPEQVRWKESGVHFIGLNVVGSANNRNVTQEWRARTDAGLAWLDRGFSNAVEEDALAVVVAFHANPFGGKTDGTYPEPFAPIMNALVEESDAFDKPVLLIHGDSHYYRWDIPFRSTKRRGASTNLSRLEVFGSPNPHWVEVMVDPESPEVFAVRPHFLEESLQLGN